MEINNLTKHILFVLYIIGIERTESHRPYTIEFTSLKYEYNKNRVKLFDLKIVPYNNHSAINGSIIFSRDIHNFYMDLKVEVPKNKRRSWLLLNTTVNGCEFLKGINNRRLNFAYIAYNELQKLDGFPNKCPVEKNKPIYLRNVYFDSEKSPPYLPVFNFKASIVSKQTDDYLYRIVFTTIIKYKKSA